MRDGWVEATLGDVFELTNTRLGDVDVEPAVFSVTKYDGFVLASQYFDKRIASDNLGTYKVVEPGEWAYSTIHIDEGSIARNRHGIRGVVSPMYTTMRVREKAPVMPYFVELAARSPHMMAAYRDNAQGSINRRRSLPWKVFQAMPISLPPQREQQRIVDLVGAVDLTIGCAESAAIASLQCAREMRSAFFGPFEGVKGAADSMFEMLLGRQKSRVVDPENTFPYVRAANLLSNGSFDLADMQSMYFAPKDQTRFALQEGDVMVVEGGVTLGRSALWKGELAGTVGFDKHMIRLRSRDGISCSDYALHWATWANETGVFAATATGITIPALGFGRASALLVPQISLEEQAVLCAPMTAADDLARAAEREAEQLRTLRANLLTALLSGEHEIPESYDELMETLA